METVELKGRGGARPGAGRKRAGTTRAEIRMSPATLATMKEQASHLGLTPGQWCDLVCSQASVLDLVRRIGEGKAHAE